MTSETELRVELHNGVKYLERSLKDFTEHVRAKALAVWMWRDAGEPIDRVALPAITRDRAIDAVTSALSSTCYIDGQDTYESRIAPGLLVLDMAGIKLANEVNGWKVRLAAALAALNGHTTIGVVDRKTGALGPRKLREVALESIGEARLHYHQAIRHISVLRESPRRISTPDRVSFTWSACKTVRRTTREALVKEISERLRNEHGLPDALARDLAKLKALPEHEPLALVYDAPQTVRANVAWPERGDHPRVYASFSAVAPVVMLGEELPRIFNPLPDAPSRGKERKPRSDTKLEDTQLLETMPAFRYLRQHRRAKHAETA